MTYVMQLAQTPAMYSGVGTWLDGYVASVAKGLGPLVSLPRGPLVFPTNPYRIASAYPNWEPPPYPGPQRAIEVVDAPPDPDVGDGETLLFKLELRDGPEGSPYDFQWLMDQRAKQVLDASWEFSHGVGEHVTFERTERVMKATGSWKLSEELVADPGPLRTHVPVDVSEPRPKPPRRTKRDRVRAPRESR